MSSCPDTADGWHVWKLEIVPEAGYFSALEVGEVRPLRMMTLCGLCGAIA